MLLKVIKTVFTIINLTNSYIYSLFEPMKQANVGRALQQFSQIKNKISILIPRSKNIHHLTRVIASYVHRDLCVRKTR